MMGNVLRMDQKTALKVDFFRFPVAFVRKAEDRSAAGRKLYGKRRGVLQVHIEISTQAKAVYAGDHKFKVVIIG